MSYFLEAYIAYSSEEIPIDNICQEGFLTDIVGKIKTVLKAIWNTIRTIVSKIFNTIAKYFKKLVDAVKGFFKKKKSGEAINQISDKSDKPTEINEEFKKDVKDGNVVHIRSELTTITLLYRDFRKSEFDDYLEYAKNAKVEGLFDKFDGEEFKPKEEWDTNYWHYINATLMDNFCMERINHLKEVGKYVYGKKSTTEAYNPSETDEQLLVPFHHIYSLLVPEEEAITAMSSTTVKFFTEQTAYIKKMELSDTILSLFNGGKKGEIDSSGNISYMKANEKIDLVYKMSDSERGYKLQTASDILKYADNNTMTKLNTKFAAKHAVLKAKITSVYNILQDSSGSMNDLVSKKISILYGTGAKSYEYKKNFNYNINVVKSMAKAIIEELNAIGRIFNDTCSAVMKECFRSIRNI